MKNSNLLISYQYEHNPVIESIKMYVSNRYPRFLEYSKYHATRAGIPDEANDVLNEVLLSLFSKDFEYLVKLYSKKRNSYTDLDFYILNMLKMNCHSLTSPYRHKNRPIPADHGVNYQRLKIVDDTEEEVDQAATTLRQFKLVRFIFNGLALTEMERKVFEHAFILHSPQSEFTETNRGNFYKTYYVVRDSIHEILYFHKLTNRKPNPKPEGKLRRKELVSEFLKIRKLFIKHSEN